ncbi:MAG TPA: hypothetical protein VMG99_09115 [Thermoplasmata archaeon]|nr:hypothetical protein [Thermoplasmata archaeon]
MTRYVSPNAGRAALAVGIVTLLVAAASAPALTHLLLGDQASPAANYNVQMALTLGLPIATTVGTLAASSRP